MRTYEIRPAEGDIELCGDSESGPWSRAGQLMIDVFPWYNSGDRQLTSTRLLYDAEAIYGQFICEDKHIYSVNTELNSNVCQDSCVEFFATYDPCSGPEYFNIEMNCCATILVGHGPARRPRTSISPELAAQITVVTSICGPTKEESPDDNGWWAAFRMPFTVISELAGRKVSASAGDKWRANFFRCGGNTDRQHAMWNPIDTDAWPQPDFHRPESFGELVFV